MGCTEWSSCVADKRAASTMESAALHRALRLASHVTPVTTPSSSHAFPTPQCTSANAAPDWSEGYGVDNTDMRKMVREQQNYVEQVKHQRRSITFSELVQLQGKEVGVGE